MIQQGDSRLQAVGHGRTVDLGQNIIRQIAQHIHILQGLHLRAVAKIDALIV